MPTEDQMHYLHPCGLAAVVEALANGRRRIIAGGTDLYPAHVGKPLPGPLLDVSAVAEMRGITVAGGTVRFGGAVTWTEIACAVLPPVFTALQEAARQVGSLQVQNRGTIAGNLCNASPAADGVPPLLVLEAEVELASAAGMRRLPLSDFITGYRKTQLRQDEVLSAVIVPDSRAGTSVFSKLGARAYLVISIVMVAALVRKDAKGVIAEARIAIGSASEKAERLPRLEADLVGLVPGKAPSMAVRTEHLEGLRPIGDVRATAAYRLDAARQLIGDALDRAAEG